MDHRRGCGKTEHHRAHQKQGDGLLEQGGRAVAQVLRQIDSVNIHRLEQIQGHTARPDAPCDPVLDPHGQQVPHDDRNGGVGDHIPLTHAGNGFGPIVGSGPKAGHGVHDETLDQDGGDHVEAIGQCRLYPDL